MKRILTTFLLFLLLALSAQATHLSGGEIYYDCLGNDQYRVTLVIYRDCAGVNLSNSFQVSFSSPCDTFTTTVNTPTGVELSQLCDLDLPNSTCNGGTLPGIQQYTYQTIVTLPPCDFWTISWSLSNRNGAIANLASPANQQMYIAATLNNTVDPCDDSPQFTAIASPYVCLNYPVTYSLGAFDPEGDSLTYTLIGARGANGAWLNYNAPWSATQPITGLTINPQTGLLSFTPTQAGNWVVVVQVNEYDTLGNLIGTVMRDMQFVAYPCSNVPPNASSGVISNPTGGATITGNRTIEICESASTCFDMVITDVNTTNVLTATTNLLNVLPGATFNVTGTNPITCTVCWSGSNGTAGYYPFTINVDDGACPIPGIQTYAYTIHVLDGVFIDVLATDASCQGVNNGSVAVNVLDGTAPYQYDWGSFPGNGPVITAGAGTYTVQVTDDNGCESAPATATINAPSAPVANAGPDQVVCQGSYPVTLNGAVSNAVSGTWSGGSGTYTGSGTNVQYTPSAGEIAAGMVTLTLTATSGNACPSTTDMMQLALSNSFLNTTVTGTNASCFGTASGTATYAPVLPGVTYQWSTNPVQTTSTANGLAAGTYSVTATDALGCSTTASVTIGQPAAMAIANLQVVNETCAGQGNGTASVTVTGGTAPYTYQWSNGGQGPSIVAGAGNYTVSITDANGCAAVTATATIGTTAQNPTANAGPDLIACQGQMPVALNGAITNAASGAWSGGAGSFTGSGTNVLYMPSTGEIAAGGADLTLTATSGFGCPPATDVVHIAISNSFLNAAVTGANALCNGTSSGSASYAPVLPGLTYQWSTNPVQTTPTATGLGVGSYTLTVTDGLGCSASFPVTITQPQALTIGSLQATDETCAGQLNGTATISVVGGTPPYAYTWSNGQTTPSITAGAGSYTVSVTDANGCAPVTAMAVINAAGQPNQANAGPDQELCYGAWPVALQGTVVNATGGTWSGGGTFVGGGLNVQYSPSAAELSAGYALLTLTTTGNTTCPPASDQVLLTLTNSFQGATITTSPACSNASTGTAVYAPANAALTYQWSPGGATTPTITGLAAGTYTLNITDTYGCDTTMVAQVTAPPALVASTITAIAPTCPGGTNGSATVNASGGTPGYAYQWSANAGSQNTPAAANLGAGTFICVVTDAAGCITQQSITLTTPPALTLSAQVPDTVCINAPVTLTAQAGGGTAPYQVQWVGIGYGSPITYSFPGSQNVQVTVTDGNGCQGPTLNLPLTTLNLNAATLAPYGGGVYCPGAMASIGAVVNNYPGAVTFTWPELGLTGEGPFNVAVTGDMTYTVIASNSCGQSISDTLAVDLEVPPVITLPPVIAEGCAPLTVTMPDSLTTVPVTYLWDFGDGSTGGGAAAQHTYGQAGTYSVSLTVTTMNGCSAQAASPGTVIVHDAPAVDFTASPWSTTFDSPEIDLTATTGPGVTTFDWMFGDGGTGAGSAPSHTYGDIGTFTVVLSVMDANGCTAEAEHDVVILPIYDITIPTAFSPNPNGGSGGSYDPNDLSNDVFYPFVRFVKDFRMRIYNRWGELVFESTDVRQGWDGYYRGQLSQQDVYVYQMWVRFVDDKEIEKRGDLTLFR